MCKGPGVPSLFEPQTLTQALALSWALDLNDGQTLTQEFVKYLRPGRFVSPCADLVYSLDQGGASNSKTALSDVIFVEIDQKMFY